MKNVAINYQTDFMPYSRAIRIFKNMLNDIFKNEPGYEKIRFKSRKTDDINNELIDYFNKHKSFKDTINFYTNNDLNDPEEPFCILFQSDTNISDNTHLSLDLVCTCSNECYVHAFINSPIDTISDSEGSYQCISINPEIIQLIPNVIDDTVDKFLDSYIMRVNPNSINDIPDVFKKYNMKCVGLSIMR